MPNLTQIDFRGASTKRVSDAITRILVDCAGRLFHFPSLTAVIFRVGPTLKNFPQRSSVHIQVLQLFLLTLRSVETLDEIHSVFRGLEFLDGDDGLLPQIQSLYQSRAAENEQDLVDSGSDVDQFENLATL
ncbi:hypothetical protein EXIGLDRAFT_765817 [Exidia glandulosa HHB12029]|uniref:Uncharacterized protein n=1 Tax=Exidia glandulosa HHB12029 TaxID=1314781 RepID=A0A165K6G4_EXIGL|nr:hypothetical protein EXIGLDRAFT_765817 [Exidia glandulosa HHB12029]